MAVRVIAKADGPFLTSGTFNAIVSNSGGNCYQHLSNTDTSPTTTSYVSNAAHEDGPNAEVMDGVLMHLQQASGSPGGTFSVKLVENGGADPAREITVNVADLPANGSPAYVFLKFSSAYTANDSFTHNVHVKSSVDGAVIVGRSSTANLWHDMFRKSSTAAVPVSGDTAYIVGELTGAGTGTDRYVTPGDETGITVTVGQRGFHTAPPSPPTVTSVSASSGPAAGGTAVTITGTNLTGATAVTFGGSAATGVSVVNSTTITCTTPAHAAGAVDVAVTNPDGTGTGTNAYTYVAAPTVTSVTPNSGYAAGSTPVTITGTGFTATITGVTFGGSAATSVVRVSATSITCVTPAHAVGAVNVVVTNSDTQTGTGTNAYTYVANLPTAQTTLGYAPPLGFDALPDLRHRYLHRKGR